MSAILSPSLNIMHPYIVVKQIKNSHIDLSNADTPSYFLHLPMMYTPSFGAGCYGNHWHAPSRSSPDRAGNYDIAGSDSGSPSYSQYGSRSTRPGERLQGVEEGSHTHIHTNTQTHAHKQMWR